MKMEEIHMTLANRLYRARKENGFTQSEIAEKLNVSFQAVSLWERGETTPDIEKLPEIAKLYHVSVDWLLTGKEEESIHFDFQDTLSDRLFDENRMYTYVKTYATMKSMMQTLKVLPYARQLHHGQVRKGKDRVPYIYHPLLIACHALALGLDDDDIVSTALLHDVCEDCGVLPEELPVNEQTKEAVDLLTKKQGIDEETYYEKLSNNSISIIVKLLDRCNNVSTMGSAFTKEKITEYIRETEKVIYPLLQKAKIEYPMYSNQFFLIKYHLGSVMESIKHLG